MEYPADAVDLNSKIECALDEVSSGLKRVAAELGAEAVAVLFSSGSQIEITYFWSGLGDGASQQLPSVVPAGFEGLKTAAGPVAAEDPLAHTLRALVSRRSQSFLLFPWRMQQRVVTVVFCFALPVPPRAEPSEAVTEKLRLVGLATWSVKEIAGLRSQLRTVTSRLAGRKLVERAKGVLQIDQGITEEGAYEHLRKLSRKRRITLAEMAEEVVREGTERNGGRPKDRRLNLVDIGEHPPYSR
jgi:hypothetical protein